MSVHVSGERTFRPSPFVLWAALVVVVLASLAIAWMARFVPSAPANMQLAERATATVAPRASFPECLSCGTVLIIRTFELRDETPLDGPAGGRRRFVYRVTVQMDDGSYRTFSQSAPPAFAVGAKVRVLNGVIAART